MHSVDLDFRADAVNWAETVGVAVAATLTVLDSAGDPADLSGHTLRAVVMSMSGDEIHTNALTPTGNVVPILIATAAQSSAIGAGRSVRWALRDSTTGDEWIAGIGRVDRHGSTRTRRQLLPSNLTVTLGATLTGTISFPAVFNGGGGGGGGVTDHGALTGLSDDDHALYALADGSRGAFASAAQGATADATATSLTAHTTDTTNPHTVTAAQAGADPAGSAAAAYASAASDLAGHTSDTTNPHTVTAAQAGADPSGAAAAAYASASGDLASHSAATTGVHGLGALSQLDTVTSTQITDGTIVNADISPTAAITRSRLESQPQSTILGRGAGSGTGPPLAMTIGQTKAALAINQGDVAPLAPVTNATTAFTLAAGNASRLTVASAAGAVTVTVPTGTFAAGAWFAIQSTGAGGVTLSTTGITINGAAPSVGVAQNEVIVVVFTAANTISVLGGTA